MKKTFIYSLTVLFVSGALSVSAQSAAPVQSHTTTKRQAEAAATAPKAGPTRSGVKGGQVNQTDARPQTRNGNVSTAPMTNSTSTPATRSAIAPTNKSVAPGTRATVAPAANADNKKAEVNAAASGK
jgi:hypothetical protein